MAEHREIAVHCVAGLLLARKPTARDLSHTRLTYHKPLDSFAD